MRRVLSTLFFLGVLVAIGLAQIKPIVTPGGSGAPAGITWPSTTGVVAVMGLVTHTAAGATETVDWSAGSAHRIILDESLTLTLTNPATGGRYSVVFVQDAGAGNTVTWADEANIYWGDGGVAPIITATANAISLCTFIYDGTLSKYLGACSLDHK